MKIKWMKKCFSAGLALILCGFSVQLGAADELDIKVISSADKISNSVYQEIDRLEMDGANLTKEKIPVWIWYKDIDQKQVDREVEEQTGLTQENLAVNIKMPDITLMNSLKTEEPGSQEQMHIYLEQTTVGRKLEMQRSDEYVMKRRKMSSEKYIEKGADIINKFNITLDDIIFKSHYAPTFVIKLSIEQIEKLSQYREIELISLFCENNNLGDCSVDSMKQTIGLQKVCANTGLSGNNVKVGMYELSVPMPHDELDFSRIKVVGDYLEEGDHAVNTARILAGTKGVAPGALLYATTRNGVKDYSNIEELLDQGVKVINASTGEIYNYSYTYFDKWYDHVAQQHNVLFICSTGNEALEEKNRIRCPATAYNTLAVGGYDDKETGTIYADDDMYIKSSYNHGNGCIKPDLIAPANNVLLGGTSTSAPIVTGIATLLLELKPSLGFQPQTLKAILMASCQRKVKSPSGVAAETMEQGLTERQGAGAIDAWNAVCIVAQGNYGYGEVKNAAEKRNFVQPAYGAGHMNVSIAWLRENTLPDNNHINGNPIVGTQQDLDLSVYRGGTLVGSSSNANSSTEMAYFPLSASESRYQIRVSKEDLTNTETVRYGYAWSTDNMKFRENLTGTYNPEGIYYIRNQANANGAYLTVDEQTGRISQEAFTGEANQQWVSRKTGNDPFTIRTNSGAYPGYLSISGQTIAQIRQDEEQYVTFGGNGFDNTYGIQLYGVSSSASRSLTALNGAAQSAGAVWQNIGVPERFMWYFEPVGYLRGDVNQDGKISTADALLAQKYVNKQVRFDAAQEFLGDMNNDGLVNLTDIKLIQQAIA